VIGDKGPVGAYVIVYDDVRGKAVAGRLPLGESTVVVAPDQVVLAVGIEIADLRQLPGVINVGVDINVGVEPDLSP